MATGRARGVALMLAAGLARAPASAEDVTLKMAVPDWPPTHIMKDLFDKNYKPTSGNNVKLDVDFIPWPDYYTRLNASLTSGEKKYNMAVSDSQWLGAFIEGGYYLKINKYVDADPGLQAVFKDLHPAVKASYSTYPYKSDKLYGFPQMPDLVVNYYRKDVFCDATEQKNFKAKYNYKLPCTPEEMDEITWDNYRDIGEFFKRKKGEMLDGQAARRRFLRRRVPGRQRLRLLHNVGLRVPLAARRRHLGRDQAAQRPCRGRRELADGGQVVRAPAVVHEVHAAGGSRPANLDIFKTDELFRAGKVAMQPRMDRLCRKLDQPGDLQGGRQGRLRANAGPEDRQGRSCAGRVIGGQPFVLMTWNTDAQNKEALDFCKWWLSKDTQIAFAKAGGQSALKSVYTDPSYVTFRPWNRTWAESLDWQKDFWHIPEFFELLTEQQEEYTKAMTGQQDAKTTLDNIANFQEKTAARKTGRIK